MTGRVIVITSGKGGVGKTTTNANIGTALARAGKKVVMVGAGNIGLIVSYRFGFKKFRPVIRIGKQNCLYNS